MNPKLRLRVYEAIRAMKIYFEYATIMTDAVFESVRGRIVEHEGQFYDKNGLIQNLPGYAAQRAYWRLIDSERRRRKLLVYACTQAQQAARDRASAIPRRTVPNNADADEIEDRFLRAEIRKLERSAYDPEYSVTLTKHRRIGAVLRMRLFEKKAYSEIRKELVAEGLADHAVLRCMPLGSKTGRSLHGGWQSLRPTARCTAVAGAGASCTAVAGAEAATAS